MKAHAAIVQLAELIGIGLVIYGCLRIWLPLGLLVGGISLIFLAYGQRRQE